MNRKVTKVSTVTPKSTLTNSKSIGQGVKNIGKAKKYGPVSMAMGKKAAAEGAELPQLMRKAVKTGTKVPKSFKAKMLPEVKVTAPGKLKRFVSKITSKRK